MAWNIRLNVGPQGSASMTSLVHQTGLSNQNSSSDSISVFWGSVLWAIGLLGRISSTHEGSGNDSAAWVSFGFEWSSSRGRRASHVLR